VTTKNKKTTKKHLMVFSGRAHPLLAEQVGDLLREGGMGPATEDHQVLLGGLLHSGHKPLLPRGAGFGHPSGF
jgi:hypothetical protein